MTDFENQVLSALKDIKSEMNERFDKIETDISGMKAEISDMKEDIEMIKEDTEITRVATNANGQKLEELEQLLKDLKVIA